MMRPLLLLPPALAMIRRQKLLSTMIVIQVAILTAVITNAMAIMGSTLDRLHTPTGVDESNIGVIRSISVVGAPDDSNVTRDLNVLRNSPFVVAAAYGSTPLMKSVAIDVRSQRSRDAAPTQAYLFQGSQGFSDTLGLSIVKGRDFSADDPPLAETLSSNSVLPVLITNALSRKLFPNEDALGKIFYSDDNPMRVIGILKYLRAQLSGNPDDDLAIVSELRFASENLGGAFTIRAQNGTIDKALSLAAGAMKRDNPSHVQVDVFTLADKRLDYFATDIAATRLLLCVITILLLVLAAGFAGLTNFAVQRRQRQIGIMRALGATKSDIRLHFLFETALLVACGAVAGTLLTYLANHYLNAYYGLVSISPGMPVSAVLAMTAISLVAVALTVKQATHLNPAELVG